MTRASFSNPIAEGADPWVIFHEGRYYWCLSAAGKGVFVFSSDRLNSLGDRHLVWSASPSGPFSDQVWAPELHRIDGVWYIYTTASDGDNANHRLIVLECREAIPTGKFQFKAQLYTGDFIESGRENRWAIDATPLRWEGKLYLIWSGWRAEVDEQWLYIAPMSDPWTISGNRVCLCANNDYLWERVDEALSGRGLNEAPQVLQRAGRAFVVFSASGSWQPSYKLGLLEFIGSDPLLPESWRKHPAPCFVSTKNTWGVGHGSFTISPDGTEAWMVYHAKETNDHDWLRSIFVQPFSFAADGLPVFGEPVSRGQRLALPSGTTVAATGGDFHDDFATDWDAWDYWGHQDMIVTSPAGLMLGDFGPTLALFRAGEKIVLRGRSWQDFRLILKFTLNTPDATLGVLFGAGDCWLGYLGQTGLHLEVGPDKVLLQQWLEGRAVPLAAVPKPVQSINAETVLSLEMNRDLLMCSLNGDFVLRAAVPSTNEGSIGVRLGAGRAIIRDIVISAWPTL